MKFSLAVIALIGVNGVQIGHRHHHHHKHHHHHNNGSIPACNSATFPGCVTNAETAADGKLQADMDKHPKDYVVPNFGVDHDIISTQANIRKAGGKLHQVRSHHRSVPACNSHTHPACKDAITQAPEHLESLWRAGLAQAQSVPACNSHTRPGCVAGAKSAGLPDLAKAWKADDSERPDMNQGFNGGMHLGFNKADRNDVLNSQGIPMPVSLVQARSIPSCNSHTFPACTKGAQTASPWKLNADPRIVDPEAYYKGIEDERIARKGADLMELKRLQADAIAANEEFKQWQGRGAAKQEVAEKKEEKKEENSLIQSTIDNMDINQQAHMSQKKSDPIASSTGWLGPGHNPDAKVLPTAEAVVDYATNQPLDHDIVTTHKNIQNAEASVGRKLNIPPTPASLSVIASDMRSDPAWNSHTGYETRDHQPESEDSDLHRLLNGHDIEYPEPHLSEDIKTSQKNLKDTEALLGHQYQYDDSQQVAAQIGSSLDVRSGVFSKNSVHFQKQKSQEMASMRERMMSNWGTK